MPKSHKSRSRTKIEPSASKKVKERGGVDLMPEMQTKPVNKYLLPRIKSKSSQGSSGLGVEEETDATGLLGWVDRALSKL